VLSTPAAHRLRMLLTVLAGTVVLALVVVAAFLVVGAVTAGPAVGEGADWGAVY
jgi:type IV secretory pathway TrbL component